MSTETYEFRGHGTECAHDDVLFSSEASSLEKVMDVSYGRSLLLGRCYDQRIARSIQESPRQDPYPVLARYIPTPVEFILTIMTQEIREGGPHSEGIKWMVHRILLFEQQHLVRPALEYVHLLHP